MFFIIGIRSSQVAQQPLSGINCAYCGTPNALWCAVFSRYLYVGFIPVIPVGKTSITECQHCKQVLRGPAEMPAAYRSPVLAAQAQARIPLTHFALPLLVLALGVLPFLFTGGVALLSKLGAFRPAARSDVPLEVVGARYIIHNDGLVKGYTLVQATKVMPDSVYCLITGGLRGPLTPATATVALRDSVNPLRGFTLGEWQQMVGPQSAFKRLQF